MKSHCENPFPWVFNAENNMKNNFRLNGTWDSGIQRLAVWLLGIKSSVAQIDVHKVGIMGLPSPPNDPSYQLGGL